MTRQRTFTIAAFLFACGLPAVAADPPEVRSEYDVVYTKAGDAELKLDSPAGARGRTVPGRARYSRRRLARRQQR